MRFALTDEQDMLRASVRGALERAAPIGRVREWLEARTGADATALAARQGWTGIGVPEEAAGGQGGGLVEVALLVEEHARAAVPGALLPHVGLALPAVAEAAGPDDPLVRELAGGERIGSLAVDAGGPPATPAIAAARRSGCWSLRGDVPRVLGAPEADLLLVPASDGDAVALFAVERSVPEVALTEVLAADRSRRLAGVALRDAPAVRVGALPAATGWGPRAAVLIAADALGAAQRMLDLTVAYVREREQFGVPVGSFQAVKHVAADMLVDVESSRSAAYHAAWSVQTGQPEAALHASVAKFLCAEAGARVADGALALHGAVGFTWEHDLHLFYKRAKADLALFGSPACHRAIAGDALDLASSAPRPAPLGAPA